MAKDKKKKDKKKIKEPRTPKPDPHELLLNCAVSLDQQVKKLQGVVEDLTAMYTKEEKDG